MKIKQYLYIFITFILFSIPYSFIGQHLFTVINEISKKDTLSYMDFRTKMLSADISNLLISKYDVFKIVREKKFASLPLVEKKREFINITKNNPSIVKEISIIDKNGDEIFSTMKNKKYANFKNNPLFLNANNEYFSIGAVSYPENEPPELIITESLKNDYILMARLNLGYLNEEIIKRLKKISGEITLIDSGYQIIFDSNYNYLFKQGAKAEKEIIKIVEGLIKNNLNSYNGVITLNNNNHLISIVNIDATAWWLYEKKQQKEAINYSLNKWAKRTLLAGFFTILIFSYLTYKLTFIFLSKPENNK